MWMPISTTAQQTTGPDAGDKATIQALLVEVHQLRLALERSTSVVPRLQIALQRLQAQQDRVDRLSKDLRDVRGSLADHAAGKERIAGAIKQLQNQDADALDPAHKKQFEEMSTALNAQMGEASSREQHDRAQEIDLSNQFQAEQAKLNDLSDQLNALEKKLDQQ
jgi:uncharacterized protein YlxW (UPF0749 family)